MFVDEITVEVSAGKGGNGIVAFRREKFVSHGGPAGGNGGVGGSVIFVGDEGMNTLSPLKYNRHINAPNGETGKSKGRHGRNAENHYVKVPLGTICYHMTELVGEVMFHNQELIVAKGGRGGRGNMSFATNKNKAPDFAENGDEGETFLLKLELQVLADVGLIGLPNAGKSTLISALTNARPKIADYPFTTLNPNLGMVETDHDSFVIADLPGIIENAHQGEGLGLKFLKHIERCRVLIQVIDGSSKTFDQDYEVILNELAQFNPQIINRPRLTVVNKVDILGEEEKKKIASEYKDAIFISAFTHFNLDVLMNKIIELLSQNPEADKHSEIHQDYLYEDRSLGSFEINLVDGVYELSGEKIELLFKRTDFTRESSIKRFARQLRLLGVDDALRKKGVAIGTTIRIFDYEFEFVN